MIVEVLDFLTFVRRYMKTFLGFMFLNTYFNVLLFLLTNIGYWCLWVPTIYVCEQLNGNISTKKLMIEVFR